MPGGISAVKPPVNAEVPVKQDYPKEMKSAGFLAALRVKFENAEKHFPDYWKYLSS